MDTKEYSKFKFLKENRTINPTTVKKIEQSLKDWGVIPGRPILVDNFFNIIDGQHRFHALKNLELPISYEIITGDVIAKTMALNSSQSQWKLIDYIKSYADQNIDCYRRLLKFEEKYKFGVSASVKIFAEVDLKGTKIKKGGEFEVNPRADEIAEYILTLNQLSFYSTRDFIVGVLSLHKKASAKQLEIIRDNILKTPRCGSVADYITAFENILNYKKRGRNVIKL